MPPVPPAFSEAAAPTPVPPPPAVPVAGEPPTSSRPKWLIPVLACGGLFILILIIGAIGGNKDKGKDISDASAKSETTTTAKEETTTTKEEEETTTTPAPTTTTQSPETTTTTTTTPPAPAAPAETVSQSNARQKAADYLSASSFSRRGLIEQLVYEGFSADDSIYGADAQNADWNEQAAKKAADYLRSSSFSRSGLIDQLVYDGFTQAEAEYGVSTTGL